MKKTIVMMMAAAFFGLTAQSALASDIDAEKIFNGKCKMCHKIDSKKMGPAVKLMNPDEAVLKATITDGRKMMPAYGKKLTGEEIDALVAFIKGHQGAAE
ncbi:Cytochrome C oxidase, cbb3-type, subunit III [Mariprofundus ferrinatatus]|uniref:Cytochrome C oxidase, cbb3-type, subunit III n=1 Tax=Mariprofundus ferrinatatus TaxID=1921087 RepID=A0A2K8L7V3_9PROT|nr:cytochrome c [Mariprofundus ferrinatatus]ATX81951.1 Cytochrome C oxidase, cbb3-type, subunit III [Mariprofundus ferrinatatus]